MKKRKRKRRTTSHNRPAHNAALQNPKTRQLLDKAREEWPRLGVVARGDTVRELLRRGCTFRGLADHFSYSPSSIHWLKEIAELPVSERQKVAAGANPKPYLQRARGNRRTAKYKEVIREKQAFEREVNKVEGAIHEFISKQEMIDSSRKADQLLDDVRLTVGGQERLHAARPDLFPMSQPAPTGARMQTIIEAARPKIDSWDDKDIHPIGYASEQLALALLRIPDEKVRWCALERAQAKYEESFWIGVGPGGRDVTKFVSKPAEETEPNHDDPKPSANSVKVEIDLSRFFKKGESRPK